MSGYELEKNLADGFKVQLEMSGKNFALALTSVADTSEGFERLVNGVKFLDAQALSCVPAAHRFYSGFSRNAVCGVSPRSAVFSPWEKTSVNNSIGKISADFICEYPPGIPVLAPGELITENIVDRLSNMSIEQIKTIKGF
jgi:arginine/lysine/ornithine decarboxylase